MTREQPDGSTEGGNPVPERGDAPAPFGAGVPGGDTGGAGGPRPRRSSARRGSADARFQGLIERTREGLAMSARGEMDPETLRGVVRAALARYAGPAEPGDGGAALARSAENRLLDSAPVYARRPHWTEEPASVLADLAVAAAGRRAMALLAPPLDEWYGPALQVIAGIESFDLVVRTEPHLDGLRALAGVREVALECGAPDAGITGLAASLQQLRDSAVATPAEPAGSSDGWFGEGVVSSPPAPIRAGMDVPVTALVGLEPAAFGAIPGRLHAVAAGDGERAALRSAARQVAQLAFGSESLGGHAGRAASRALIRPTVFSGFTEALLEALDDGFASGSLGAPSWASERPHRLTRGSDLAIELARKVGIEEGATLVFERKRPGDRALVFTNVEPRMALAGHLGAPCLLALQRAGATM